MSESMPPKTNRGAETPAAGAVHVDWLEFTLPRGSRGRAEELVGGDFEEVQRGLMGYEGRSVDGLGAEVLWTGRREDVHAVLRGSRCRMLSNERMRGLLERVRDAGGVVTRIDLAFDDQQRVVEPEQVWRSLQDGEVMTHTHVQQRIQGLRFGEPAGETVYIGSARSRQKVRVYDKERESATLGAGVRWEVEAHEEPAETLSERLIVEPEDRWGLVFAQRLVAIVDFREAGPRPERRRRLSWYSALVGAVQKVRAYVARAPRTLGQVKEWLRRQIGPMLAVAAAASGDGAGFVLSVMEDGRHRWRERHRLLLLPSALEEVGA